jgi:proteasome lid subunit RPN8/RPN11
MKIKRELLEAVLELCRNAHPKEIGGLLIGKKTVDDYVIVPGKFYDFSIYVRMDQLPIYPDLYGTFHSHPTPDSRASKADLDFFGRLGKEHLIIAWPYNLNSFQAYDSLGKKAEVTLA